MNAPRLVRAACDRRGASAVEFALVALPFLLLIFGVIEIGRAMWAREALQETAIAGARCMGVSNSNCAPARAFDSASTTTYIQTVANGWGIVLPSSGVILSPNATCAGIGGFSSVRLNYTFQTVTPGLLGPLNGGLALTATACFPNNS
jgi:Flp pilus assembly protein TadG